MFEMKWVTGVATLVCTGALLGCGSDTGTTPDAAAGTGSPTSAVSPTAPAPSGAPSTPADTADPLLSGKREITIVRVQASEVGLALDGQLVEADDSSGRELFVPTPIGGGQYVIKAYGRPNTDHPANDEPSCWQVNGVDIEDPLTIQAAECDADNPIQRFTITARGSGTYAIGSESRFLQHSGSKGLTLEEPGGTARGSTFRFVDRGPARVPAGG